MTNQQNPQVELTSQNNIPFEQALTEGFKKLTNEVFLFLLCYMIIMVGLEVTAKGLIEKIRPLVYIIPLGGVAAYVWLEKSKIPQRAKMNLQVGEMGDRVVFAGRRGGVTNSDINMKAKRLTGNVEFIGEQAGYSDDINYLIKIYKELNLNERRQVINSISEMLDNKQLENKSEP